MALGTPRYLKGVESKLKAQLDREKALHRRLQSENSDAVVEALIARMRQEVGAFAFFRRGYVVGRLPKTRSGKILRSVLRDLLEGRPPVVPSTIDDVKIVDEIADVLASGKTA